jgi:hypothetical protein
MWEKNGVQISHKYSIYNMTQEDLEFKRSTLICILWESSMNLFVHLSHHIPIANFEFGKILIISIEAFFKIMCVLFSCFNLFDLL